MREAIAHFSLFEGRTKKMWVRIFDVSDDWRSTVLIAPPRNSGCTKAPQYCKSKYFAQPWARRCTARSPLDLETAMEME